MKIWDIRGGSDTQSHTSDGGSQSHFFLSVRGLLFFFFFFFPLCSIYDCPPADSCSLSRCFSSSYTINKTSFFKLWHITGSENHMEIHANSTSCAPAGLGGVIHILDVIYYRLNVTRLLDKKTHVVLFLFLKAPDTKTEGELYHAPGPACRTTVPPPWSQILPPRSCQSASSRFKIKSHTLRIDPGFKHLPQTLTHTNTHTVINAFGPPPFSWCLHRNPAAGTGVRSSQDGQTHTQTDTRSHTHRQADNSLLTKLCYVQDMFPVHDFKIKAEDVVPGGPSGVVMVMLSIIN